MVVSCCNHVSHVRSSGSSSLTLSRVPLFWWVLVPHTVTPFLLYHASPFSLQKYPKHLSPLLGLLWLWVWCFLCTPAKTHITTEPKRRSVFLHLPGVESLPTEWSDVNHVSSSRPATQPWPPRVALQPDTSWRLHEPPWFRSVTHLSTIASLFALTL